MKLNSKSERELPQLLALLGLGWAGYNFYQAWLLSERVLLAVAVPGAVVALLVLLRPRWTTLVFAVLVTVGAAIYLHDVRLKEADAFRPMASAARGMTEATASDSPVRKDEEVVVVGKVLIWDFRADAPSDLHYSLPVPARATPGDGAMTIFVLHDVRSKKVGDYYREGETPGLAAVYAAQPPLAPAYQDTADIAVVRWPENRLVAWHSIAGDLPPERMSVKPSEAHKPVHGEYRKRTLAWIQSLRKVPAPASPKTWTEVEAREEAKRRYPLLGVANSPMNRAFVERYQQKKLKEPEFFRDPAWPLRLAEEVAR